MEALLTVKEAAEITRLKTKTLYTYAERRIIPHPGRNFVAARVCILI